VSSAIKPDESERRRMTKQHRKRTRASQEIPGAHRSVRELELLTDESLAPNQNVQNQNVQGQVFDL
jgi:hypothetical protein